MKERPILFSGPMVRAILDGRKSQTRRVVNVEKWKSGKWARDFVFCDDPNLYRAGAFRLLLDAFELNHPYFNWVADLARLSGDRIDNGQHLSIPFRHKDDPVIPWEECGRERIHCPHGWPGMMGEPADRLWVKETFACENPQYVAEYKAEPWRGTPDPDNARIFYAADPVHQNAGIRWRPSIFMPRWASRITLEIVAVRVERLQDTSEADAIAEGIERSDGAWASYSPKFGRFMNPITSYHSLWESINGPGSWAANPWVWVIEFKRIHPTSEEGAGCVWSHIDNQREKEEGAG